jgi:hypothetical protein
MGESEKRRREPMPSGGARPGAGRPRNIPLGAEEDRREFTLWEREQLSKNPNVSSVTKKTVSYTKEFKELFWMRINAGVHAVTIFAEAGIDPALLGQKRISGFAKQLRKQVELGLEFQEGRNPSFPPEPAQKAEAKPKAGEKFDIPKPPRLPKKRNAQRELYTDDEITDLIHAVAYMTQELEFIKKIISSGIGGKSK